MAEKTNSKLEYIVADSAAFIKNAPLHNLCENVYTVEDVIKEIRSKATRQRLSVLPYRLNFRQPSAEAVLAGNSLFIFIYFIILPHTKKYKQNKSDNK